MFFLLHVFVVDSKFLAYSLRNCRNGPSAVIDKMYLKR